MRDVDRANLKGTVRTVTTERRMADGVFVEERTFDTDGRLLNVHCLRDGVPPNLPSPLSGTDFSVKSMHNHDGSRVDIQQVIGIDGWSMEGLSFALGTHGASHKHVNGFHGWPVFLIGVLDEFALFGFLAGEARQIGFKN